MNETEIDGFKINNYNLATIHYFLMKFQLSYWKQILYKSPFARNKETTMLFSYIEIYFQK